MANITRYDPFGEMTRLSPFSDDFFKGFMLRPIFGGMDISEPQIKVDVAEDDKAYTVKAEIPGVKKEDIKVSIDGNLVSISAEVNKEKEEKEGKKVICSERYCGSVSRSFTLACDVDQSESIARYCDGVLQLTLPKKSGTTTRQLTIS